MRVPRDRVIYPPALGLSSDVPASGGSIGCLLPANKREEASNVEL
jgi:hypothetical protein